MRRKQNQENREKEDKKKSKKVIASEKRVKSEKKPKKVNNKNEVKKEHTVNRVKKIIRIIILLLALIITYWIVKNRHILGITLSRRSTEKEAIVIETNTAEGEVLEYQRELLICSKGNLATYSRYGEKSWEHKLEETFIPEVNVNGKYIQVINKDTGNFYVFSNKYEKARKKIDGIIKTAIINKKGYSAIHYSTSGSKSVVGIYNRNGNLKYKVTLTNSNIIDMKLSDNTKYMAIYEVGSVGVSVSSSIKLVDFSKENNIKEIIKIESDIVYDMFFSGNNLILMCSEGIYKYNLITKKTIKEDITNKNISYISADKTGYATVFKDISKDYSIIKVKDFLFNYNKEVQTTQVPKYFTYKNNLAYVSYAKKILIYNKLGMLVKEYTSDTIITEPVIFNNGKNIAIKYSNKILIVGI